MILINFLLQVAILRQQLAAARAEATALRRVLREREQGPGGAGAGGGAAVAAAALEQAQTCVSAAQVEAARLRMQLVSQPGRVSWFASCDDLAGRPAVLKPKGARARDVASFSRVRQRCRKHRCILELVSLPFCCFMQEEAREEARLAKQRAAQAQARTEQLQTALRDMAERHGEDADAALPPPSQVHTS